jgi:hypothetical protein
VTRNRMLLACLPILALVGLVIVSLKSPSPRHESSAESRLFAMLRDSGVIRHPDLSFTLSAREVRQKRLFDVVLKKHNEKGEIDVVICARQAILTVQPEESLLLVQLLGGHGLTSEGGKASFEERTLELRLPEKIFR